MLTNVDPSAPPPETKLVDRARIELEERVVTLQLAPGSVARMAMDGLVSVIRRAGIVVSEISIEDQLAVLETRGVLEKLVSVRAAVRSSDEERGQLIKMAQSIERAGMKHDVHAYLRHHFQIKRFVARCARNPHSERALRPLHTLSQRFYFAYHREFDNLSVVGPAHAKLTRAIAEGDEALAASCSDVISEIATSFTRDLLDRKTGAKRRAA